MDEKLHHPFLDYKSAVKRGNTDCKTGGVKILPREEVVAWRNKRESVFVRGFDTGLTEHQLKKAMANHFSSCGEILVITCGIPSPEKVVTMIIRGQGVKEKVEQLNGSDLGGFKLAVKVLVLPKSPSAEALAAARVGYILPESTRRLLELERIRREARREKRFKQRVEKEMTKLSLNKKENQAEK